MDMSKAALPPRSGRYSKQDEQHPLFPMYRQHLNGCARMMIDASDFRDWLYQWNHRELSERWAAHPQYPAFLAWMRAEKAGARPCCPTKDNRDGLWFPKNFQFWLDGGRW